MPSDPEELLRSIERTREELALTVDTIAGRLHPKRMAKRGIGRVRDGVTGVVDGARVRFHLGQSGGKPIGFAEPTSPSEVSRSELSPNGHGGVSAAAVGTAKNAVAALKPTLQRVPKPVIGGALAALVALAAVLAARHRRR